MPPRTSIGKRKDNVSRELDRQIKAALFERATFNPPRVAAALRQMHTAAEAVFKDLYEVVISRILFRETWGRLRCRFGISSALVRDPIRSQFVTGTKGKDFSSSQTAMSSRIGASLRSQIVISIPEARSRSQTVTLKRYEYDRCLRYAVTEKRASMPTDFQYSADALQR
jgi:hypothetical protein